MSEWMEFERDTLEMLASEIEKLEIPLKLYPPDDQIPVHMLVTMLEKLGRKKQDVKLELCFLPLGEEEKDIVGVSFLQYFATISENVGMDVEESVLKAANAVNSLLPIGSVGLDQASRVVYLKYCCPYMRSLDRETLLKTNDAILGMIIQALDSYADVITEVAEGKLTAEEGVKRFSSDGKGGGMG